MCTPLPILLPFHEVCDFCGKERNLGSSSDRVLEFVRFVLNMASLLENANADDARVGASVVKNSVYLFVNGKEFRVLDADPRWTLLTFLRDVVGLKGTKLGCGEGGCGACTVMLSYLVEDDRKIGTGSGVASADSAPTVRHISANACLTPLCACDGCAVTTVEGIGGMKQGLHPIQERLANMHGSQCGFCTPGIIMSLYTQLRQYPDSTPHQLEECMDGNLCRCTGYRPIIDAARSLSNQKTFVSGESIGVSEAEKMRHASPSGGCCQGTGAGSCPCKEATVPPGVVTSNSEEVIRSLPSLNEAMHAKGWTEPIFPPALRSFEPKAMKVQKDGFKWYTPLHLTGLLQLKAKYPQARLVVGNTEVGIETKFKGMEYKAIINPSRVRELKAIEISDTGVTVGAAVTVNRFRNLITELLTDRGFPRIPAHKLRGLAAIKHQFTWFASNQIRNMACIGGNICTASPISDLNPMLIACGAVATNVSQGEDGQLVTRQVPMRDFFLSYRKVNLEAKEILLNVFIPFTSESEFVVPLKQARRREDDISIVTGGFRVRLTAKTDSWAIESMTYALGGMAPTAIRAANTENAAAGAPWSAATFDRLYDTLRAEMTLPENVPGGQPEYRSTLAVSFMFRSFLSITEQLQAHLQDTVDSAGRPLADSLPAVPLVGPSDASATEGFMTKAKAESRGEQNFHISAGDIQRARPLVHAPNDEEKREPVGQPVKHKSADLQVTGAATYTGDIVLPHTALHACLVSSTKAHARLKSVDLSEAEKCPGYHSYITGKDVHHNRMGAVIKDEEVFAEDTVRYVGMVIGVILASTHEEAVYAARKVKIEYEELPAAVSIDEAVAIGAFYTPPFSSQKFHTIKKGDVSIGESESDVIVEGTGKTGSQEHFYLETNISVCMPLEHGQMEIHASTQNPTKTQAEVAEVLGMPMGKVAVRCKRMGGGFGGKEERSIFITVCAAVAAQVTGRTVSILIERDVDMSITGQRHAFQFNYRAGCTKDGQLKFLDAKLYSNAGWSLDLSQAVMDRALFHSDNVYQWPNQKVEGYVCRTNQPSHTAFRGFGGPQGMMLTEMVIEHLSKASGIDIDTLRQRNFYKAGDFTHFGQTIEGFNVPSMWERIQGSAEIAARKEAIQQFNAANKWKKRGISTIPTKFGINFTYKTMNQGGALVHVYMDGTVLISHGGTEMGQGLHTKMVQIAAQALGISHCMVTCMETATNAVANSSPTAASASTDLYGMAVLDACEQIMERLRPIKAEKLAVEGAKWDDATWKAVAFQAYFNRINLSAQGFYAVPTERCGYNWDMETAGGADNARRGQPFNYFTQGVATTEVEIDCLTGDSHLVRTDILMDIGKSINPALDVGQIEGAFIQGYGWVTMEDMAWGDGQHKWIRPGNLFTKGPGTYKIPSFNDVPHDFRIHLFDTENKFCVHSSKAVGEPPFFLGSSAFFAIRDAVNAARTERGFTEHFALQAPATSERIRMSCIDQFTERCMLPSSGNHAQFQAKGSW
jgi:xanthine dehydrogenase/oxidase